MAPLAATSGATPSLLGGPVGAALAWGIRGRWLRAATGVTGDVIGVGQRKPAGLVHQHPRSFLLSRVEDEGAVAGALRDGAELACGGVDK
jgi:hypothetical protein